MGRCGYLAWSKRKLKRGTAGTCLVTHITLEADSPFHAITKQSFQDFRCIDGVDDEHKQTRQYSPSPRSHTGGFAGTLG